MGGRKVKVGGILPVDVDACEVVVWGVGCVRGVRGCGLEERGVGGIHVDDDLSRGVEVGLCKCGVGVREGRGAGFIRGREVCVG